MKPGPIMQCRLSSTVKVQLTCCWDTSALGTYEIFTTCVNNNQYKYETL